MDHETSAMMPMRNDQTIAVAKPAAALLHVAIKPTTERHILDPAA